MKVEMKHTKNWKELNNENISIPFWALLAMLLLFLLTNINYAALLAGV